MAYQIPRNVKGEGRIFFVFSTKSLITTGIGAGIGLLLRWVLSFVGLSSIGLIATLIFAGIGYIVGTLKMPNAGGIGFMQKTAGENRDEIILRWLKFKMKNKKKIYVYLEGGEKNDR